MIGLYGGAFDPPHLGHVALARAAVRAFGLGRLVVLVAERPGHRTVVGEVATRLELARLAFPDYEVECDPHERTDDLLPQRTYEDPLFLVGADQLASFSTWKEPDAVLELARLGVATRPGYPREELEAVLGRLARPERVLFFELEPIPIASRDIRARLARGETADGLVPDAVARAIAARGLYRG